ncbi:MAG: hypothetical protein WDZ37_03120 [Solirubrobacterales bacterium]
MTVRVDWHGYAIDQVEVWADKVVQAAWAHGFAYVEFVHGAPDLAARGTLGYEGDPFTRRQIKGPSGRGTIKDTLRKRLFGGRWKRWVVDRREGRHSVDEGSMRIALRENPSPDTSTPWPMLPPPAHG